MTTKSQGLLNALGNTMENVILGMLIGTAIGVALAGLSLSSGLGEDLVRLVTAVINPLPPIAILPLALLWFGLSRSAIIFVTALGCIWPISINLEAGFRGIHPTLHLVMDNLILPGARKWIDVLLPASLPYALSGLRLAWALSWRVTIAAELVFGVAGSSAGLGFYMNNARQYLLIPKVFAALVLISIVGVVMEQIIRMIEQVTVRRWGMQTG